MTKIPTAPGDILEDLAPGVRGYSVEVGGALLIPLIIALRPGKGDVGRYLDTLPDDRLVAFPSVLSPRLAGMLERRGFRLAQIDLDDGEPTCTAFVRVPKESE